MLRKISSLRFAGIFGSDVQRVRRVSSSSEGSSANKSVSTLLLEMRDFIRKGDRAAAQVLLDEVNKIDPDHPWTREYSKGLDNQQGEHVNSSADNVERNNRL
jgi:hypothetical protein